MTGPRLTQIPVPPSPMDTLTCTLGKRPTPCQHAPHAALGLHRRHSFPQPLAPICWVSSQNLLLGTKQSSQEVEIVKTVGEKNDDGTRSCHVDSHRIFQVLTRCMPDQEQEHTATAKAPNGKLYARSALQQHSEAPAPAPRSKAHTWQQLPAAKVWQRHPAAEPASRHPSAHGDTSGSSTRQRHQAPKRHCFVYWRCISPNSCRYLAS